jgi:hypothetical protein
MLTHPFTLVAQALPRFARGYNDVPALTDRDILRRILSLTQLEVPIVHKDFQVLPEGQLFLSIIPGT